MDDLTPSRSLDNIFSQDEEAFLNMLLDNNSSGTLSPANDNLGQPQLIEQVPLPSLPTQIEEEQGQALPSASTFFFNGDATTVVDDNDDASVVSPSTVVSSIDLPLLLPVKPELIEDEEPLFSALPDIFPTIDEVGTPDSADELSDMSTSPTTSSVSSPKIKKETKKTTTAATKKKKKQQPIKEEKKKRAVKPSKRDANARPGKKQKTDNLTPFIRSLKGMNSMQLEEYASTRTLTSQQQAELKDWIRKIKNRESASNSRKNRKSHQQVLEAQLEELDTRNEELQEEIKELEIENRVLRGELVKFRELIVQSNLGKAFEEYNKRNKARALAGTKATTAASSATTPKVTPTIASPKMSAAPVPTPLPRQFGSEAAEGNLGVDEASSPLKADEPAESDASAIATPTATLPTGTKDQIESYRAQTLARLGEAVAKMVQKGKARREDVALVLYLLIVLHQCGQFLTTPAQLAQQMGIPSAEAVSVVV